MTATAVLGYLRRQPVAAHRVHHRGYCLICGTPGFDLMTARRRSVVVGYSTAIFLSCRWPS
ncbi:hypothetical protein I545_6919 [Mycobacterium kansasii 662]|uniref:Uncharacterized protein n=1 Tax=Mycobacterium kansasii 662 TaxID=1299326 RepID=X7XP11_MYCKA|nr:hypothetical protein I545_6919 [Mycobacterium kansasii 662]